MGSPAHVGDRPLAVIAFAIRSTSLVVLALPASTRSANLMLAAHPYDALGSPAHVGDRPVRNPQTTHHRVIHTLPAELSTADGTINTRAGRQDRLGGSEGTHIPYRSTMRDTLVGSCPQVLSTGYIAVSQVHKRRCACANGFWGLPSPHDRQKQQDRGLGGLSEKISRLQPTDIGHVEARCPSGATADTQPRPPGSKPPPHRLGLSLCADPAWISLISSFRTGRRPHGLRRAPTATTTIRWVGQDLPTMLYGSRGRLVRRL